MLWENNEFKQDPFCVTYTQAVTPDSIEGAWGQTQLAPGITPIQGCLIEAISTFVLTFTAFSATDENRKDVKGMSIHILKPFHLHSYDNCEYSYFGLVLGSVPLAIGICICAIVMCSVSYAFDKTLFYIVQDSY